MPTIAQLFPALAHFALDHSRRLRDIAIRKARICGRPDTVVKAHPGQETFRDRKRGLNRPVRLSFKGYAKPVRECAHGARAGLFCCALARASELKGVSKRSERLLDKTSEIDASLAAQPP